jgi:hypothetical protein
VGLSSTSHSFGYRYEAVRIRVERIHFNTLLLLKVIQDKSLLVMFSKYIRIMFDCMVSYNVHFSLLYILTCFSKKCAELAYFGGFDVAEQAKCRGGELTGLVWLVRPSLFLICWGSEPAIGLVKDRELCHLLFKWLSLV